MSDARMIYLKEVCGRVANRYKSTQEYEDLMQETLVACYELLEKEPEAHPAKIWQTANQAAWDYMNLHLCPVSIPATNEVRRIGRGGHKSVEDGATHPTTAKLIRSLMGNKGLSYDESILEETNDYEREERDKDLVFAINELLTPDERSIIFLRYFQDMTQYQVSELMCMSQSWVAVKEEEALEKLCNNL